MNDSKNNSKPNIIVILADDLGYSDLGCYGSTINTPNIDFLAEKGLSFSQFYTCAKCSPSRACLLTGMQPHQVGMGLLAHSGEMMNVKEPPDGYIGNLPENCITIAEILKNEGYSTYMSGKWHLSNSLEEEDSTWPRSRGFDHYYGNLCGATSYFYPQTMVRDGEKIEDEAINDPDFYYTDAISEQSCEYIRQHLSSEKNEKSEGESNPFFLYVSYTCPHWPLHAKSEDIEKYRGKFNVGWDNLREKKFQKQIELGLIKKEWALSHKGLVEPDWDELDDDKEYQRWMTQRMEVYAAMVDCMDQGIGRIIETLRTNGQLDNTIVIFLSDNGASDEEISDKSPFWIENRVAPPKCRDGSLIHFGCDEEIKPGPENTWQSYGIPWSNLSNAPFKGYKSTIYEGGISAPLIFHWPDGNLPNGEIRHQPSHLVDLLPTLLEILKINIPEERNGLKIKELEGKSLFSSLFNDFSINNKYMFWEHLGCQGVREDEMKLVKTFKNDWELYNMNVDRTENEDLSKDNPELVSNLEMHYNSWAKRSNVLPFEEIKEIQKKSNS